MSHIALNKEALTLANLRDELAADISPGTADTISIDMYGPTTRHPVDHLGYWNFKLPGADSKISIAIDLNRISFQSVVLSRDGKRMIYKDHWINPEFTFSDRLDISIILWSGDKSVKARKFEIGLIDESRSRLQQALRSVSRLDTSALYTGHFCDDRVPSPKLLVIESTSRCNLRCSMCPRTINRSPTGEFADLDEGILDNLEEAAGNAESICLSWMGEPLANRRLPEIIRRIRSFNRSAHISITSNGMLLSEEAAGALIDSGLDSINVSIDAADPAIYKTIRAGADLETVKNNIRMLGKVKNERAVKTPSVGIACVAGENNIGEMPGMISMARELEVENVSLTMMDDFALTDAYLDRINLKEPGRVRGREAFLQAENIAREKQIALTFEMPLWFFHTLGIERQGYLAEDILFDNTVSDETISSLGLQKGCQVPWQNVFIAHNGDVHPCCVSPRILGSLRKNTFEQIWNGEAYRAFRRRLKSYDSNEECRKCRRAIWNKVSLIESAKDWMEVDRAELHGLGWSPAETDRTGRRFRDVSSKSTFFLRDSGKPYLSIIIGNERRRLVKCRILVNNREIGTVAVPYGWQTEHFDVSGFVCGCGPPDSGRTADALLKVDLAMQSAGTTMKIAGAYLLAEEEIDKDARRTIKSNKSSLSRVIKKNIAHIKQMRFYLDRLKRALSA